jgi:SAM-dependent methyltransferase
MHRNAEMMLERHVYPLVKDGQDVLELGPDKEATIRRALPVGTRYRCADPYVRNADSIGMDGQYTFKCDEGSFDWVISANVAEHVRYIWVWVKEQARVLRSGGHLVIQAPVTWRHHNVPIDCWRIYDEGGKALLEWAGLKVVLACTENLHGTHSDTVVIGRKE